MEAPADVVQSVETPPTIQQDDAMPKAALTPPTSEDNDPKREERMSSELSEVDSDDGEDIEPDHYWDGGKIPVFKPVCVRVRGGGVVAARQLLYMRCRRDAWRNARKVLMSYRADDGPVP